MLEFHNDTTAMIGVVKDVHMIGQISAEVYAEQTALLIFLRAYFTREADWKQAVTFMHLAESNIGDEACQNIREYENLCLFLDYGREYKKQQDELKALKKKGKTGLPNVSIRVTVGGLYVPH